MRLPSRDRSIKIVVLAVAFTVIFGAVSSAAAWAQTGVIANADAATQANAEYGQGVGALQRGDLPGARAAFEKVLRLVPSSPEGHNSLGWVLLAQGQTDDAIVHFRAALRAKPAFAQAHINLSNALVQKGDHEGAVRQARDAVQEAPRDSESHHALGRALAFAGDNKNAVSGDASRHRA